MIFRISTALMATLFVVSMAVGQNYAPEGSNQKEVKDPENVGQTTITVISPNGKEELKEGSLQNIKWKVQTEGGVMVAVDSIQISLVEVDGNATSTPKVVSLGVVIGNPEKETWVWESVSPAMDLCKIEVRAFLHDKTQITDESDESFTIIPADTVIDDPKPGDKKKAASKKGTVTQ